MPCANAGEVQSTELNKIAIYSKHASGWELNLNLRVIFSLTHDYFFLLNPLLTVRSNLVLHCWIRYQSVTVTLDQD